jgi:FtsZ-binding cell division protein ZapB
MTLEQLEIMVKAMVEIIALLNRNNQELSDKVKNLEQIIQQKQKPKSHAK